LAKIPIIGDAGIGQKGVFFKGLVSRASPLTVQINTHKKYHFADILAQMRYQRNVIEETMHKQDPLKQLAIADPDLAKTVAAALDQKGCPLSNQSITLLVEETLWGLAREISFGRTIASGYTDLIGAVDVKKIYRYRDLVRSFGRKGPTLGRIMAEHLVPVIKHGDNLFLKRFLQTLEIMLNKGTYTLKNPLKALSELLDGSHIEAASATLDLLGDTFSQEMSYVRSQHFAHILPGAVLGFSPSRRAWQIEQLRRVIKADFHLADSFLDGLEKGLYLLSKKALSGFVSLGLEKLKRNPKLAKKFLSLESKLGIDTFTDLQVTIPISRVRQQLNRYLMARTGLSISVRPISSLPDSLIKECNKNIFVCSDGKFIYLPDEISVFPHRSENINLYKCLARLEAGHYEFGTLDFDLEKAIEKCRGIAKLKDYDLELDVIQNREDLSDLERFFLYFPVADLAADLFTIFEHGRIRIMLHRQYPGLVRQSLPVLQREARRMIKNHKPVEIVFLLYLWIALGMSEEERFGMNTKTYTHTKKFKHLFETTITKDSTVESCAELVVRIYPEMERLLKRTSYSRKELKEFYKPMQTPYGRRLRPDLFFRANGKYERLARTLKVQLGEKGLEVYTSDIKKHLMKNNGMVSHQDLKEIILCFRENHGPHRLPQQKFSIDLSWLDLSKILGTENTTVLQKEDFLGTVTWHKEWDCNLQDYLHSHVRVLDKSLTEKQSNFYKLTLENHRGLVKRIRYAFELLKPEGLIRLRQWMEGDEFDYRALLDFAIDKKAGKIPSDRLYIKHIKQTRDVAVLLLVDLSRSTANAVFGSHGTVLDVEKEAIVLFCEALEVVGDAFAIAGFSGTGRLGVDYFRIKDLDENMDDTVKRRINAMAPQRSTRMGAAIRHATRQLQKISSKVRLLIILGDGFPNDVDYKQNYAIEDTRKAIFEARSKNIYAHAITVNFAGDPKLDDLYGNVHHNVISDVRELPDKLLRIYGSLTRH
jgi:nitric oxide reductase NorD protein